MKERRTGYILLYSGIGTMLLAVVYIFLLFMSIVPPLPVFTGVDELNSILNTAPLSNPYAIGPNQTAQPNPLAALSGIDLSRILNLTTTFFLMTFIITVGYKIGNLGVQLIRPINVKLRNEATETGEKSPQKTPNSAS